MKRWYVRARSVAPESATRVSANLGAGRKRLRPRVSTSTSPLSRSPLVDGEAGRDGPAEHVAHQHAAGSGRCARSARPARRPSDRRRGGRRRRPRRRGRAGRGRPRGGSSPAPGSPASTWPRTPRAVQEHHRRAVAALEHGGRDAGQRQPSLADGDPGQQLLACVVADRVASAGRVTICAPVRRTDPGARIERKDPTSAARRRGYFHPSGRSDEAVLVRERRGRGPRRHAELGEDVLTCRSTVLSLRTSSAAIALLVSPAATRRSTCSSRAVSPCAVARRRRAAERVDAGEVRRRAKLCEDLAGGLELQRGRVVVAQRTAGQPHEHARASRLVRRLELAPRLPARRSATSAARASPSARSTAPRACAAIAASIGARGQRSAISSSSPARAARRLRHRRRRA